MSVVLGGSDQSPLKAQTILVDSKNNSVRGEDASDPSDLEESNSNGLLKASIVTRKSTLKEVELEKHQSLMKDSLGVSLSVLNGTKVTVITNQFIATMIGMIVLPVFVVWLLFAFPQCDPYGDEECYNPGNITFWFPIVICPILLGFVVYGTSEHVVLESLMNEHTNYIETIFCSLSAVIGAVLVRTIFMFAYKTPVPPFSAFTETLGAFNFGNTTLGMVLWFNHIRHLEVCWDMKKELLFKAFITLLVQTLACFVWIFYCLYTFGYRLLRTQGSSDMVISLYFLSAGILKETSIFLLTSGWKYVNPDAFKLGQAWVFLIHCFTMAELKGLSAGNWFHLFILTLTDFLCMMSNSTYIIYGDTVKEIIVNIWNGKPRDMFAGECLDHHKQEVIVEAAMYLTLEELVEFIVPLVYALCVCVIYSGPNAALVGGVGSSANGFIAIDDLSQFMTGLFSVVAIEYVGFIIMTQYLKYKYDLHLIGGIVLYFQEWGRIFLLGFTLLNSLFWYFAFIHNGMDWSFQFSWYGNE